MREEPRSFWRDPQHKVCIGRRFHKTVLDHETQDILQLTHRQARQAAVKRALIQAILPDPGRPASLEQGQDDRGPELLPHALDRAKDRVDTF